MRTFYRRAALAVTSLGLLGLVGCAEDNESELKKQEAKGGGSVSKDAQPQTLEDYAKLQKSHDTATKGGEYNTKGAQKK